MRNVPPTTQCLSKLCTKQKIIATTLSGRSIHRMLPCHLYMWQWRMLPYFNGQIWFSLLVMAMYISDSIIHRYVSDDNISETWLWTRMPIYLIQPASVFQFTSLLFNHHAISGRIQQLTVYLPGVCCTKSTVSCFSSKGRLNKTPCNNRYLDVLTNEVRQ